MQSFMIWFDCEGLASISLKVLSGILDVTPGGLLSRRTLSRGDIDGGYCPGGYCRGYCPVTIRH